MSDKGTQTLRDQHGFYGQVATSSVWGQSGAEWGRRPWASYLTASEFLHQGPFLSAAEPQGPSVQERLKRLKLVPKTRT